MKRSIQTPIDVEKEAKKPKQGSILSYFSRGNKANNGTSKDQNGNNICSSPSGTMLNGKNSAVESPKASIKVTAEAKMNVASSSPSGNEKKILDAAATITNGCTSKSENATKESPTSSNWRAGSRVSFTSTSNSRSRFASSISPIVNGRQKKKGKGAKGASGKGKTPVEQPTSSDRQSEKEVPSTNKLPDDCSEWLKKSAERWHLQPPYKAFDDNDWKQYHQERAALEWRHENVWLEDGREAPKVSSNAGFLKGYFDKEKLPNEWNLDGPMPKLKPHCKESYAEGETEKEEYNRYLEDIRHRVKGTLDTCKNVSKGMATACEMGSYIIQFWINREYCGMRAPVRTVHFENRFYSPVGNGISYDIHYRFHYRARSFQTNKFCDLFMTSRSIKDCDPSNPTPIGEWEPANSERSKKLNNSMIKMLDQHKKVKFHPKKVALSELAYELFGSSKVLSERKTWMLFARAGGVCTTGDRADVYFMDARRKYGKLPKNEESDEEA
eukprot:Seg2713.2 transcript_id=Seg2713.2/GoldUCD/mRNA.D3Y31 product="hypothetical protein" protein_id=Seg2713.2/GoldUCD/D3Y31